MQTNTQRGTTDATGFFEYSSSRANLFSVLPGVPADSALEAASNFLDVARDCAYQCDGNFANATGYLIEMAKAVVDSLVRSPAARLNDAETSFVFEHLTALHKKGVLIINPAIGAIEREDAKGFLQWASQQAEGGDQ